MVVKFQDCFILGILKHPKASCFNSRRHWLSLDYCGHSDQRGGRRICSGLFTPNHPDGTHRLRVPSQIHHGWQKKPRNASGYTSIEDTMNSFRNRVLILTVALSCQFFFSTSEVEKFNASVAIGNVEFVGCGLPVPQPEDDDCSDGEGEAFKCDNKASNTFCKDKLEDK